jgi:hypothetical protein
MSGKEFWMSEVSCVSFIIVDAIRPKFVSFAGPGPYDPTNSERNPVKKLCGRLKGAY